MTPLPWQSFVLRRWWYNEIMWRNHFIHNYYTCLLLKVLQIEIKNTHRSSSSHLPQIPFCKYSCSHHLCQCTWHYRCSCWLQSSTRQYLTGILEYNHMTSIRPWYELVSGRWTIAIYLRPLRCSKQTTTNKCNLPLVKTYLCSSVHLLRIQTCTHRWN